MGSHGVESYGSDLKQSGMELLLVVCGTESSAFLTSQVSNGLLPDLV